MLTVEEREEIEAKLADYPNTQAVCIEAMLIIQRHQGWVSDEKLRDLSELLRLSLADLDGVATFYNLIRRRPVGRHVALVCDNTGRIVRIASADEVETGARLKNRALLPGLVNAHSHAFQRVIRGRSEHRTEDGLDSFWTWREMMYSAATRLAPEDVYDAARMAFLEMVLGGITAVGEFHYLHHAPDGTPYDDPNLIAKEVVRAAGDTGLRIALLRVAYARSGYDTESNPRQARFIEIAVGLERGREYGIDTLKLHGDSKL